MLTAGTIFRRDDQPAPWRWALTDNCTILVSDSTIKYKFVRNLPGVWGRLGSPTARAPRSGIDVHSRSPPRIRVGAPPETWLHGVIPQSTRSHGSALSSRRPLKKGFSDGGTELDEGTGASPEPEAAESSEVRAARGARKAKGTRDAAGRPPPPVPCAVRGRPPGASGSGRCRPDPPAPAPSLALSDAHDPSRAGPCLQRRRAGCGSSASDSPDSRAFAALLARGFSPRLGAPSRGAAAAGGVSPIAVPVSVRARVPMWSLPFPAPGSGRRSERRQPRRPR